MKEKIAHLMKSESLTSSRLAEILEIQPSAVSHLLSGRNKPGFDLLQKILRRFPKINPDWLLLDGEQIYRDDAVAHSSSDGGELGADPIDLFGDGDDFDLGLIGGLSGSGMQDEMAQRRRNFDGDFMDGYQGGMEYDFELEALQNSPHELPQNSPQSGDPNRVKNILRNRVQNMPQNRVQNGGGNRGQNAPQNTPQNGDKNTPQNRGENRPTHPSAFARNLRGGYPTVERVIIFYSDNTCRTYDMRK